MTNSDFGAAAVMMGGVARIIDYEQVLEEMYAVELECRYYNSGAFGFPEKARAATMAWIGPPDATIRAEARRLARQVSRPYEATLATMARKIWQRHLAGPAWLMPMSHWAFELMHGNGDWLSNLLQGIGVDAAELQQCNNAAAIEFQPPDDGIFEQFLHGLLLNLRASDFTLAFPGRPVICMVHHHQQLWWTTTDPALREALELTQ